MNELEEFKTSEKLEEFTKAFTKFQSMHLSVKKDAENPHFRSTYASLPSVIESCRNGLADADLSFLQLPLGGLECSRILNRITHSSSQYVQWIYTSPISKKDPQGIGSAITYGRRYCLTSSLGLPESDDDGNAAKTEQQVIRVPEANKSYNDSPIAVGGWTMNDNQRKRMFAITKANGYEPHDVDEYIKNAYGYSSTKQLNKLQYDLICGTAKQGEKPNGLLPTRTLQFTKKTVGNVTFNGYEEVPEGEIPF